MYLEYPPAMRGFQTSLRYGDESKIPFYLLKKACGLATASQQIKKSLTTLDAKSSAHTGWNCKGHVLLLLNMAIGGFAVGNIMQMQQEKAPKRPRSI